MFGVITDDLPSTFGEKLVIRDRAGEARRNITTPGRTGFQTEPPVISSPLFRLFAWYSRRYVRKHFHSLRVSRAGMPPYGVARPLVIYANHASWWDPLVCLVAKEILFPERSVFAPMDAAMLKRYGFFRKLGFFGVEQGTLRGAKVFLRQSSQILQSPRNVLAVTPQGRFADVRERPARFEAGLGHLAMNEKTALFLPLVSEYVFWEERLAEILIRFGPAIDASAAAYHNFSAGDFTSLFERAMAETQDALARESMERDPEKFSIILSGGAGQGGVYDFWRGVKARWRGEHFQREHGEK